MPLPFPFNFKNPDYRMVQEWRIDRLNKIRADRDPNAIKKLKLFYADNPNQLIIDWGMTFDPRNLSKGLPAFVPFILFPKQEEWVFWLKDRLLNNERGLVEKSRAIGMSWLFMSTSSALGITVKGFVAGVGGKKRQEVDSKDEPGSLMEKARMFIFSLPVEFRAGCDIDKNCSLMKIHFPETDSYIRGDSGDGYGRSFRAAVFFKDEVAFTPRAHLLEASLSQTAPCVIDVSTPNGRNNQFAKNRFGGKINVFTFHWRDNPFVDEEWYEHQKKEIGDPVIIAQELDINYDASVEGVVIPAEWIQCAIDADIKLGITPTGIRQAGLDVADEGKDLNAFAGRYGFLLENLEEWSGIGSDIMISVHKAFLYADMYDYSVVYYDADGIGAGVKGDARVINDSRKNKIEFRTFRGSGGVVNPDKEMILGRKNEDFFGNLKAQAWWSLRMRFLETFRAMQYLKEKGNLEGYTLNSDKMISISSKINHLSRLVIELSQPTYIPNEAGKIIINKMPDNTRSPNLADCVMIAYAPSKLSGSILNIRR